VPPSTSTEIRPSDLGHVPVAGIDLGGTKVRGAIADASGNIVAEAIEPTRDTGARDVITQIASMVSALGNKSGVHPALLAVGSPGVVDEHGHFQLSFNIDELSDVSLASEVQAHVGVPVIVENDANMAALGEQWQGLARGCRDFAVLSVGTGLGMGLVIDGKLHRGSRGFAGEVAYLPIGEDPRSPDARRFGALEHAAGTAGIRRRLLNALPGWEQAPLGDARSPHSEPGTELTAESDVHAIFEAARRFDPLARQLVDHEASLLADAILAVATVVDPELIIITGGIGADPLLTELVRNRLDEISPHRIRVERSILGDRCGVMGALAAARASSSSTSGR
jgi:glucokinase